MLVNTGQPINLEKDQRITWRHLSGMNFNDVTKHYGKPLNVIKAECVSENETIFYFHTYYKFRGNDSKYKYETHIWFNSKDSMGSRISEGYRLSKVNKLDFECHNDPEGEAEYFKLNSLSEVSYEEIKNKN